jgi:hypothetical protein
VLTSEDIVDATMNDVKDRHGRLVEHSLCMFLASVQDRRRRDLRQHRGGRRRPDILCSTWTGRRDEPLEGSSDQLCMDLGYDDDQIRKMVSLNTARGIEDDLPTLQ